jgi:RNA polymerase sigma-70 factor, ECF subfamily
LWDDVSLGLRLRSSARLAEASVPSPDEAWLRRFHAGEAEILEECYRGCFATVERAMGSILSGADRETATHEVFARLISSEGLRRAFRGGSLAAWIGTVARNHAIDLRRRLAREANAPVGEEGAGIDAWERSAEAHLLVERFRQEHLPLEWTGVFELRFLAQLPQRDAASRLGIGRTTLAYRELRIRRLLRQFLLNDGPPPPARKGAP